MEPVTLQVILAVLDIGLRMTFYNPAACDMAARSYVKELSLQVTCTEIQTGRVTFYKPPMPPVGPDSHPDDDPDPKDYPQKGGVHKKR